MEVEGRGSCCCGPGGDDDVRPHVLGHACVGASCYDGPGRSLGSSGDAADMFLVRVEGRDPDPAFSSDFRCVRVLLEGDADVYGLGVEGGAVRLVNIIRLSRTAV